MRQKENGKKLKTSKTKAVFNRLNQDTEVRRLIKEKEKTLPSASDHEVYQEFNFGVSLRSANKTSNVKSPQKKLLRDDSDISDIDDEELAEEAGEAHSNFDDFRFGKNAHLRLSN